MLTNRNSGAFRIRIHSQRPLRYARAAGDPSGLGIKNHVRDAGDGVATPCTSISTHTRIGDSHMGRNARTRTPRGRRIALSCGTAAGAALVAASISMGTAPVAGADVLGADTVSDLIGASDSQALAAAGVSDTMALSYLIEAFDPNRLAPRAHRLTRLAFWATTLTRTCWVPPALMPCSPRTSRSWWVRSRSDPPRLIRTRSAT